MISPEFVEFETSDGLGLPGLLYHPKDSKSVVIYLHGNGSSSVFYDEKEKRITAEVLARKKISLFAFNNRGAHIIKKINVKNKDGGVDRLKFGMAYEEIKYCIIDIDSAIDFLGKQGFEEFYLMGLSTGANKICVYNHYKPKNRITKYIILGGGDDVGIYYDILGKIKFSKLILEAKDRINKGEGEKIITDPKLFPESIFSYKAFYDLANPDGDYNCFPFLEFIKDLKLSKKPLFRYFKKLKKPSVVIYGEKDEYAWGDMERIINILKRYRPDLDYRIIEGADHGLTGYKKELAELIINWL